MIDLSKGRESKVNGRCQPKNNNKAWPKGLTNGTVIEQSRSLSAMGGLTNGLNNGNNIPKSDITIGRFFRLER